MVAAFNSGGPAVSALRYVATLALVVWAMADIVRQPRARLSAGRKAAWGLSAAVRWLLMGLIGGVVAAVHLFAVRPRLRRPTPWGGGGWTR